MSEMAQTDAICGARRTHYEALNILTRCSAIEAFVCSECGWGLMVNTPCSKTEGRDISGYR
jgi:hypothetical protein